MEKEIWKDIPGHEGLYQASNLGEIKSLSRKGSPREFILKQGNKEGYRSVVLTKGHQLDKTFAVHRLVSITFIPNPKNKETVNHINGIKSDNRVENLEWNTRSENILHAFRTGLKDQHGDRHHQNKLMAKDVLEIRRKFIPRVYGRKKLAKEYGVTTHTIKSIVRKQIWTTI